jgi:hypothetical protein
MSRKDAVPEEGPYHEIPDDDPFLQAEVNRALAPAVKRRVPPEVLKTMRETLMDALRTHPVGARVFHRARKAALAKQSGTQDKEPDA